VTVLTSVRSVKHATLLAPTSWRVTVRDLCYIYVELTINCPDNNEFIDTKGKSRSKVFSKSFWVVFYGREDNTLTHPTNVTKVKTKLYLECIGLEFQSDTGATTSSSSSFYLFIKNNFIKT